MIGWVFGLVIFASLGVVAYVRFKVNKERISAGVSTNYKKIQKSRLPNANLEDTNVLEFVEGGISRDKTDFARDLEKRLYCANWNIGRGVFHLIEVAISFGAVCFSYLFLSTPFVVFSFFIGPILCRGVLDFIVERKAKIFEQDFGQFIMSMVSLLKTGMTPVIAMESSAKALDDGSLVKAEVESLVESLRNGFNEERALSKFADTIYSPTVETFIQIMMVGKKVWGKSC
ncbi:MAG: hypothetical protein NZO16_02925 [Deltaproteobacteria bacterium]|nr:hypothetical protein [Deltaproteobacteria bacterium]